jgi:thiamine pyrophosphokinase
VYVIGTGTAKITNTTLRYNGDYAVYGLNGANISISGSRMLGNITGGVAASNDAAATTTAVVSDSIISGGTYGVVAYSNNAGATSQVFVTRCTIENVAYALDSETNNIGSTLVSVSNSMVTKSIFGWNQLGTGSVIESAGNNHIRGNVGSQGTLTPVGLQ